MVPDGFRRFARVWNRPPTRVKDGARAAFRKSLSNSGEKFAYALMKKWGNSGSPRIRRRSIYTNLGEKRVAGRKKGRRRKRVRSRTQNLRLKKSSSDPTVSLKEPLSRQVYRIVKDGSPRRIELGQEASWGRILFPYGAPRVKAMLQQPTAIQRGWKKSYYGHS